MGSSGKTSSQTQTSAFAPQLLNLYNMAKPTLQALSGQTTEALQTGGDTDQIPSINAGVAAARESYANSQKMLRQQIAQSGLAGTPFASEILGQNQETAGQQIGAIPSTITSNFLSQGVPTVVGAGTNALNTAANLDTSSYTTPSFWDYFLQGLGSTSQGAGSGIGAYAALGGG